MHVKSTGVLSLSAPGSLFPLNDAPTRATLLPQGPSMKVLDEKEHSEYLHSILPPSGEGRVNPDPGSKSAQNLRRALRRQR